MEHLARRICKEDIRHTSAFNDPISLPKQQINKGPLLSNGSEMFGIFINSGICVLGLGGGEVGRAPDVA